MVVERLLIRSGVPQTDVLQRITLRELHKSTDESTLGDSMHSQAGISQNQVISKASANRQYIFGLLLCFFGQFYPVSRLLNVLSSRYLSQPSLPFALLPRLKQLSFCLSEYDSMLVQAVGYKICKRLLQGFPSYLLTRSEIQFMSTTRRCIMVKLQQC